MISPQSIIDAIRAFNQERYRPEEYPALRHQLQAWQDTKPLKGLRILECTPLFNNTLQQYIPMLAAGAELTVGTHDAIPYDKNLFPLLRQWGLPHVHNAQQGDYDCILDCGGVHAHLTPRLGFAELTRSGFYHYQNQNKPIILVDDSRIKTIETCLGTGDGFYRGMVACGFGDFKGRAITLFGYGKVGRGIAYYAEKAGAVLTIVDEPTTRIRGNATLISRHDNAAIAKAVQSAWCVVTATGIKGAMVGNGAADILRNGKQLVAAMGVEDEWDGSLPPSRILNNGVPLNFMLAEPTRLRFIDPTMALLNAAALELATKSLPAGIQKINHAVEDELWTAVKQGGLIPDLDN